MGGTEILFGGVSPYDVGIFIQAVLYAYQMLQYVHDKPRIS